MCSSTTFPVRYKLQFTQIRYFIFFFVIFHGLGKDGYSTMLSYFENRLWFHYPAPDLKYQAKTVLNTTLFGQRLRPIPS